MHEAIINTLKKTIKFRNLVTYLITPVYKVRIFKSHTYQYTVIQRDFLHD